MYLNEFQKLHNSKNLLWSFFVLVYVTMYISKGRKAKTLVFYYD